MKNKLFIIEGPDGSGKTQMVKDLRDDILSKYKKIRVKTISLPHYASFGYKKIRDLLKDDISLYPPDVFQSLYIANMIDCAEKIINPFFINSPDKNNNVLILDRSIISTILYNTVYGGTIFKSILDFTHTVANEIVTNSLAPAVVDFDIINKVYGHLIQPVDATFFLMPPKDIVLKHAQDRDSKEEFDGAESVMRMYDAYDTFHSFLSGSMPRNIVDFLENPKGILRPNPAKVDKYIKLSTWSPSKTEEQNYKALREEVLAKLKI